MSLSRKEIGLTAAAMVAVAAASYTATRYLRRDSVAESPTSVFNRACPESLGDTRQACVDSKRAEVHEYCVALLERIERGQFDQTDFELHAIGDVAFPDKGKALPIGYALNTYCGVPDDDVLDKLKPGASAGNATMAAGALSWIDLVCDTDKTISTREAREALDSATGECEGKPDCIQQARAAYQASARTALTTRIGCPQRTARTANIDLGNLRILVAAETIQDIKTMYGSLTESLRYGSDMFEVIDDYIKVIEGFPINETTTELFGILNVTDFSDFGRKYVEGVCSALVEKLGEGADAYTKKLREVWKKKAAATATGELNSINAGQY